MSDTVRVLRVLEYVGTRDHVELTLSKGAVPARGEKRYPVGMIKSGIIGDWPESTEEVQWSDDLNTLYQEAAQTVRLIRSLSEVRHLVSVDSLFSDLDKQATRLSNRLVGLGVTVTT